MWQEDENRYFEVTLADGTVKKHGYDLKTNPSSERLKKCLQLTYGQQVVKIEEVDKYQFYL